MYKISQYIPPQCMKYQSTFISACNIFQDGIWSVFCLFGNHFIQSFGQQFSAYC